MLPVISSNNFTAFSKSLTASSAKYLPFPKSIGRQKLLEYDQTLIRHFFKHIATKSLGPSDSIKKKKKKKKKNKNSHSLGMIVIYEESKKIFEACQTAVQPSQPAEAS